MTNEAREKSRLVDPYLPPVLQPPTICRRLNYIRNSAHISYAALSWCRLPLLLILHPEHLHTVHDTLFLLEIEVYVLTSLLCVTLLRFLTPDCEQVPQRAKLLRLHLIQRLLVELIDLCLSNDSCFEQEGLS